MYREWHCILRNVKDIAQQHNVHMSSDELLQISYYCLFFGTGSGSSRMLKASLEGISPKVIDALDASLTDPAFRKRTKAAEKLGYMPFAGHQSRLGHYYRHLYQTVAFVDKENSCDSDEKYAYVKTLRAQLSTHEQALLLINSCTPMGQKWWSDQLITKYRMVRNIPRAFIDGEVGAHMLERFGPGYFEWEEA